VAEHTINTGHHTDLSSTSVSDKAEGYMDQLVNKATEIQLNTKNCNGDGGFTLSWVWYCMLSTLQLPTYSLQTLTAPMLDKLKVPSVRSS